MSSLTESEEEPKKKKTQIPKRTHKLKLKTRSILNLPDKVLAGAPPLRGGVADAGDQVHGLHRG